MDNPTRKYKTRVVFVLWSIKLPFPATPRDLGNSLYALVKFDGKKACALYLSVNVFRTKVLIRDTSFTFPAGDGTAILCGRLSRAKVSLLAV